MASMAPTLRPLSCWKSLLRQSRRQKAAVRCLTTYHKPSLQSLRLPSPEGRHVLPKMKAYPPPPTPAAIFKDPVGEIHKEQIAALDPKGSRTSLFSKTNPDAAKVGDILLVRQKNGDPFAGVCINIRRRGIDTGILLRNQLTRVGVEMWYKIYSPNVEGIEVVQRRQKRARRARLTYLRKPKHDMGSVQNIVMAYQKTKSVLRTGSRDDKKGGKSKGKGKR